MLNTQKSHRLSSISDWYSMEENKSSVEYYSILHSLVIILSGIVQVHFIKKLFQSRLENKGSTFRQKC
jgi:hypothetical protein